MPSTSHSAASLGACEPASAPSAQLPLLLPLLLLSPLLLLLDLMCFYIAPCRSSRSKFGLHLATPTFHAGSSPSASISPSAGSLGGKLAPMPLTSAPLPFGR